MAIAKKINTLLCEDVRQEIGNKLSLIGVYGKEIILNKLPMTILRLCLVIFLEETSKPFKDVRVIIKLPGAKDNSTILPGESKVGENRVLIVCLAPIEFKNIGTGLSEFYFSNKKTPDIVHEIIIKEKAV